MAGKKKGASPKTIKTTAAQLQDAIRDAAGAKQRAKNANANKTNALTDYALRSGFSKRALALGLELHNLEDVKRGDFMRELLMIHQMMGWGEQSDLFDDIGQQIAAATQRAEDEARSRRGEAKGTPGLPLEALEKGIKPLEEAPKGRSSRKGRNALPGAPEMGEAPARQVETVD